MPLALQKSAMPLTKPGAGTMNPPSPWIGSMITRGDVLLADVLVHLVDRVRERLLGAALRVRSATGTAYANGRR